MRKDYENAEFVACLVAIIFMIVISVFTLYLLREPDPPMDWRQMIVNKQEKEKKEEVRRESRQESPQENRETFEGVYPTVINERYGPRERAIVRKEIEAYYDRQYFEKHPIRWSINQLVD